jgi:hypothetical protein
MSTIYTTNATAANYTLGASIGYNGTYSTVTSASNVTLGDNVLKINGNPASLDVKGKVIINGLDLEERLKTIENLLLIPERDVILESKYPSLKKKYDEYIKSLEKYRMWETIKGNDND